MEPGDFLEGTGKTDIAFRLLPIAEEKGHIEHVHLEAVAVTDGGALPFQAGLLDFRPVEVTLHLDVTAIRIRQRPCPWRRSSVRRDAGRVPPARRHAWRSRSAGIRAMILASAAISSSIRLGEIRFELPFDQQTGGRDQRDADRKTGDKKLMERPNLHPFSADAGLCRTLFPVTM